MRIPPELAKTLAVVVDEGSLDAAAGVLGMTQPAVSQRLRTLERLAGQVLLVRSRPVRPTPAGLDVVAYGRSVALLDQGLAEKLGVDGSTRVSLSIAVNADSLATWFLAPLASLASTHAVTFDLHRDDEEFTAALLEQGLVVAAVTTSSQPVPGCSVRSLGRMTYRAVATPSFVARHFPEGVTAHALESAPRIDFDRRDQLQHRWLELRGARPDLPPRHRVPASSEFATAIEAGLGWGMLPSLQLRESKPWLVALGEPDIDVPLYWQQWRTHSATLDAVAQGVTAAAGTALGEDR